MGLGPGLHIRQTQTLVMSHQLQQAISCWRCPTSNSNR